MLEIIESIKCRITIITNGLPIYNIILLIYLVFPAVIITDYGYRKPKVKQSVLAIILLVIWLIQMIIWDKAYHIYYTI